MSFTCQSEYLCIGAGWRIKHTPDFLVKEFIKQKDFDHEQEICKILEGTDHTLKIIKVDTEKKILYMEKCDYLLSTLISLDVEILKIEDKMKIVKQMLLGIIEMHERGIIHGCITGRNFFISKTENEYKVVIGNFRLSGTSETAQCGLCSPWYRSEPVINDYSHDMYSFGIFLLVFLGDIKLIDRFKSEEEKHSAIKNEIHDENLRIVIANLLSEDPNIRFTAQQLMTLLFPSV